MDWASLAGILLALAGLLVGQGLEGGKLASLFQPAAFAIVVFGTLGAILVQTETKTFRRSLQMLSWIIRPPENQRARFARDIIQWSQYARRDGLLSLERPMKDAKDKFVQKGLRLVVDGIAPEKLRSILEQEVSSYEYGERQAAKVWESAGGYSPTIGILGAVLGLIHVMENLTDPSKLGSGIAVAFVSTVYGVGLANLLFFPIGTKLRALVTETVCNYEILTDVFFDIASGDHSRVIEERVACLLHRP